MNVKNNESVLKSFFCEKYNAICFSNECKEGIEVKNPIVEYDSFELDLGDSYRELIRGPVDFSMTICSDGSTYHGKPPEHIGHSCTEVLLSIERKKLRGCEEELKNLHELIAMLRDSKKGRKLIKKWGHGTDYP